MVRLAVSILLTSFPKALTAAVFSEAKRIVLAAEGLLLAHRFPFNYGIRVELEHIGFATRGSLLAHCVNCAPEVNMAGERVLAFAEVGPKVIRGHR